MDFWIRTGCQHKVEYLSALLKCLEPLKWLMASPACFTGNACRWQQSLISR